METAVRLLPSAPWPAAIARHANRRILWIMCDQLRYDYLSCTGHPTLKTPNIDALAERGVRFSNADVQSPICGPSRVSFYTGRYMRSHGSHWNGWLMRVGEPTLAIERCQRTRACAEARSLTVATFL